jgi:predicted AlkP superfamily pyrophosphatase or phosphodiesterase
MRSAFSPLLLLALLVVSACAPAGPLAPVDDGPHAGRALLLVSIDGFHPDYLARADIEAPTLRRIAAEGVRARRMVSAFPTKTFPNHYTLVTGLYPETHGIVSNTMFDPAFEAAGRPSAFSLGNRAAVEDSAWWGGEPIWVTAERQGVRAATMFWPGSETAIRGVRPSDWMRYDDDLPYDVRVDTVLAWLDRPAPRRPQLLTLYFSAVDTQGHRHGPDAPETARAVEQVDAALARLVAALEQRGLLDRLDLVVVSDHGMVETSPERVIVLDDVLDLDAHRVMWGEPVGIWPADGQTEAVLDALGGLDHLRVFRKEDLPARLHYHRHRRIPPIVLLADEGWTVTSRAFAARVTGPGGAHGYDNAYRSMDAFFAARGPRFRAAAAVDSLQAVDVYGILAGALGLVPAPHDGDPAAPGAVLRPGVVR